MAMSEERAFTIRIDFLTLQICRDALAFAPPSCHRSWLLCAALFDGCSQLSLTMDQALCLQQALELYREMEVREGSKKWEVAGHFAATLDDHLAMLQRSVENTEEEESPTADYGEAARLANAEKVRADKLRDSMLRDVFLGGARKKIDIWGNVVDDDGPMDSEDLRRMAKTISAQDWKDAIAADLRDLRQKEPQARGSGLIDHVERRAERCLRLAEALAPESSVSQIEDAAVLLMDKSDAELRDMERALPGEEALKYNTSARIPLSHTQPELESRTKPMADVEADMVLTEGSSMTYNEDMKIEGANELLVEQKGAAMTYIADGIVSTVSAFMAKTSGW